MQPPWPINEVMSADVALDLNLLRVEYRDAKNPDEKKKVLKGWLVAQEGYLLKPMNCPHHIQIYKAQPHSYRDLPVRLAEFGTVYRFEQSGELNGMTRVRGFTQDDAHLFCTPDQVETELEANIDLVLFILKSLGLNDYAVRVSLRDPKADKYVGALAGSDIQTNPPATNAAVQEMKEKSFTRTIDQMPPADVLAEIDRLVDFKKMEEVLMEEGLKKFADPQKALLKLIGEKRKQVA